MAKRRVVLQGWFGMDNFGDDLLLHVTLFHLLQHMDDVQIDVIGEGRVRPAFLPPQVGYLARSSRLWNWRRKRWLRSGCDWILCGGSILAAETLDRFIEPAQEVKKHGGRVFLHAIGLRKDIPLASGLKTLMALVNQCSVRESYGWKTLSQLSSVDLVADPVFAMNVMPEATKSSGNILVALRGSDKAERHIDAFAESLKKRQGFNTPVQVLVCFPRQDLEISRRLVSLLGAENAQLIGGLPALEQADMIARAGRVISMRLHPAIVALSAGVVPWVLDAEHKQHELMHDVGKEAYLFSWDEMNQALVDSTDDTIDIKSFKMKGEHALELLTSWISHD